MANFFAGPRLSFDFPCRRQRKSRNLQHPGTMSICRLYADHTSDRRTQDEATEAWLWIVVRWGAAQSKLRESSNAAEQSQWSRTEGRMLSERSRATPDTIPSMSAPAVVRSNWVIWIGPLDKPRNKPRVAAAYRALAIRVGQDPHHGPPLFWIGSRAARSPRITPRKRSSAPSTRMKAAAVVNSYMLPTPRR